MISSSDFNSISSEANSLLWPCSTSSSGFDLGTCELLNIVQSMQSQDPIKPSTEILWNLPESWSDANQFLLSVYGCQLLCSQHKRSAL